MLLFPLRSYLFIEQYELKTLNTFSPSNSTFCWSTMWLQHFHNMYLYHADTLKQNYCTCGQCEHDSLLHAHTVLSFKNANIDVGRLFRWTSRKRKKDNGRRTHLTASVQSRCQLQASFNLRVWTTAWAGSGRIHASRLLWRPLAQTGFSIL